MIELAGIDVLLQLIHLVFALLCRQLTSRHVKLNDNHCLVFSRFFSPSVARCCCLLCTVTDYILQADCSAPSHEHLSLFSWLSPRLALNRSPKTSLRLAAHLRRFLRPCQHLPVVMRCFASVDFLSALVPRSATYSPRQQQYTKNQRRYVK